MKEKIISFKTIIYKIIKILIIFLLGIAILNIFILKNNIIKDYNDLFVIILFGILFISTIFIKLNKKIELTEKAKKYLKIFLILIFLSIQVTYVLSIYRDIGFDVEILMETAKNLVKR